MSKWIGQVDSTGQPRNAVTVIYVFGAVLLCTILPSRVAFFSLVSAGGVPTIAAYGLLALLRLTMTPNNFKSSYFYLGRFRKLLYLSAVIWNALIVAVCFDLSSLLFIFIANSGYDITFLFPSFSGNIQLCEPYTRLIDHLNSHRSS